MRFVTYFLLISLFILGCGSDTDRKSEGTYFGGEVVNPISNYITISKDLEIVDTVPLDKNNRFLYKFEDVTEGLYQFRHGEFQIFHLQKGDSLMARVNTQEFDESLAFSGHGAERSNFLIKMFLMGEREDENFQAVYQKTPVNFKKVIDSLNGVRKLKLQKLFDKKEYSENFTKIATAAAFYDNYQRMETYPFPHFTKDRVTFIEELPEQFYNFRNDIDLNTNLLRDLIAYQRYVSAFLDQQAFLKYGKNQPYNRFSYAHNRHKIKIIDSIITEPNEKNYLLRRIAREFIANSNNQNEVDLIFSQLTSVAGSPETIKTINTLKANHKSMEAGNKIPNVKLVTSAGDNTDLASIIKRPTVLFFWSDRRKGRMFNSHLKAADLKSKYPEFDFIGITVDNNHDRWLKTLKSNKYKAQVEYRFLKPNEGRKELVVSDLNKTIVINKNGTILNSHANLHHSQFENDLLAYLNQ